MSSTSASMSAPAPAPAPAPVPMSRTSPNKKDDGKRKMEEVAATKTMYAKKKSKTMAEPVETAEPAVSTSVSTKKKPIVYHPKDLNFMNHVVFGDLIASSGKCNLVPMSHVDGGPILIQLNGGGRIPSFGLKKEEGVEKMNLAFEIACETEHESLEKLRGDISKCAFKNWSTWIPDKKVPPAEVINELCGPLVGDRKKKKNSDDKWPGLSKASFDTNDVNAKRCRIVYHGTQETLDPDDLPGMTWKVAIIELKFIYMQASKSFGTTRRLRYLSCEEQDDFLDIQPL